MQRYLALALALLPLAGSDALAQRFVLRLPPVNKNELQIGMRMLQGVDVGFSNIGNVNGVFGQWGEFDNGYVRLDTNYPDDYDPETGDLPPFTDGKTAYFHFLSGVQLVDANGNVPPGGHADGTHVLFTQLRGEVNDPSKVDAVRDSGTSLGWEIQYTRYLTDKKKLGLMAGFGVNGASAEHSAKYQVRQFGQQYIYELAQPIPGGELDSNWGYTGHESRPLIPVPGYAPVLINLNGQPFGGEFEGPLADGEGLWLVDSGIYTFRFGAIYNLDVTRKLDVRVGAGLAAIFVDSTFKWTSVFAPTSDLIANKNENIIDQGEDHTREFMIGGWVDAAAHYQINSRTTFYGALEYQNASGFEQGGGGATATIDTSNMIYARTGFTWAF